MVETLDELEAMEAGLVTRKLGSTERGTLREDEAIA